MALKLLVTSGMMPGSMAETTVVSLRRVVPADAVRGWGAVKVKVDIAADTRPRQPDQGRTVCIQRFFFLGHVQNKCVFAF